MLQSYWQWLRGYLGRLGVEPIVINNWAEFKALLGSPMAPVHAIVIFLHGPVLPYQYGLELYDAATDQWVTVTDPYTFVKWLADMVKARGWVVVFPYGPPMAFVWDTQANNWYGGPNAYVTGSLLASFVTDLLGSTTTLDVSYIYVYTGGFTYASALGTQSLSNYTVGAQTLAYTAAQKTGIWGIPRMFIGNYSIVSRSTLVYDSMQGFWINTTPPPGLTWSSLRVPAGGYAGGAVAVFGGRGAAVFVTAPRPGATPPNQLAAIDVSVPVYVWLEVLSK